jgi:hypothetical protein
LRSGRRPTVAKDRKQTPPPAQSPRTPLSKPARLQASRATALPHHTRKSTLRTDPPQSALSPPRLGAQRAGPTRSALIPARDRPTQSGALSKPTEQRPRPTFPKIRTKTESISIRPLPAKAQCTLSMHHSIGTVTLTGQADAVRRTQRANRTTALPHLPENPNQDRIFSDPASPRQKLSAHRACTTRSALSPARDRPTQSGALSEPTEQRPRPILPETSSQRPDQQSGLPCTNAWRPMSMPHSIGTDTRKGQADAVGHAHRASQATAPPQPTGNTRTETGSSIRPPLHQCSAPYKHAPLDRY